VRAPSLFEASPADAAWSVAQVTHLARQVVEQGIGPVWVRGEISGFKAYSSGHWYFTLRDADAQLRCVMWKSSTVRAGPSPADGAEVFARGMPTVWEERGEFRLNVTDLLATTAIGAQQLELERIRKALERDGLLDPARKRPLPLLAQRIAVVTSVDGAALRDIITVSRKRWPAVELLVIGSRVQGEGAEDELVHALGLVNRLEDLDVCIIGRGGGSREDLAAFNAEAVCRALAEVRVPTISAVGHETDLSLCDYVADVRAATPSAAAELAVADRAAVLHRADSMGARLATALRRRTRLAAERLARTADRMQASLQRLLADRRARIERFGAQLDALSPLRVLARGYGVAQDADGRVLKRTADFVPGEPFRLRVIDGAITARAEPAG
jgi:exodeoxyribonuclease VII large subunit